LPAARKGRVFATFGSIGNGLRSSSLSLSLSLSKIWLITHSSGLSAGRSVAIGNTAARVSGCVSFTGEKSAGTFFFPHGVRWLAFSDGVVIRDVLESRKGVGTVNEYSYLFLCVLVFISFAFSVGSPFLPDKKSYTCI
jgi:hypothetical protein